MTDNTQLFTRYHAHLTYPLEAMLITLAIGGMMSESDNLKLIQRAACTVQELEAYNVLPL